VRTIEESDLRKCLLHDKNDQSGNTYRKQKKCEKREEERRHKEGKR
jgi:hypothetical protein